MSLPMVPPVYRWLLARVELANMVGDQVYAAGRAPPSVSPPYITWQQISGTPENYTDDDSDAKACRVQINYWGAESGDATALALQGDQALKAHGQKLADLRDEQEPETGHYVFSSDWLIWLN